MNPIPWTVAVVQNQGTVVRNQESIRAIIPEISEQASQELLTLEASLAALATSS
jgi:hypothetical protein